MVEKEGNVINGKVKTISAIEKSNTSRCVCRRSKKGNQTEIR